MRHMPIHLFFDHRNCPAIIFATSAHNHIDDNVVAAFILFTFDRRPPFSLPDSFRMFSPCPPDTAMIAVIAFFVRFRLFSISAAAEPAFRRRPFRFHSRGRAAEAAGVFAAAAERACRVRFSAFQSPFLPGFLQSSPLSRAGQPITPLCWLFADSEGDAAARQDMPFCV